MIRTMLGLVVAGLLTGPVLVSTPMTVTATSSSFTDIDDSKFRIDILWLAEAGITVGCAADRFCPKSPVRRDQMATFLKRAMNLPPATRDWFRDDATNAHHDNINRLADAGVTHGCAATLYCPKTEVTRAQMATFLARALELPATTRNFFSDDGWTVHEDAINRLAAAGITYGCGADRFCPRKTVTREQMAAFLRRAYDVCPATLQSLVDAATPGATLTVPACTYRETVTITKPLTVVGSGARVDGQGVREFAFVVKSDDVTIDGFEVTGTVNPAQEGAVQVRNSNRFTLRNANVHHAGGACISIKGGSGHQVLDSELAYCAQQGFHLPNVSDSLVARNRIHHNNPDYAYDSSWEAGGGKAVRVNRLTFEGNEVYANRGPGIWCDIDCRDVVIRENRVHHNEKAGIYFEISDGAVIHDNVAWENGWKKRSWGWGGGIVIASSRNVEVRDNVVAWNADGISVISQNRTTDSSYQPGVSTWGIVDNVDVHHNDILLAPQSSDSSEAFLLAWLQDWDGVMFEAASNNRGAENRYWHAQAEPTTRFAWERGKVRLADFNATPGESDGTYLSTSQRSTVISGAHLPGPEPH
jgi:nitrous oxidase accessory protein NosD